MSEATMRQQRRDLRRAIGDEGLALLDQHTIALNQLHQAVPAQQTRLQEFRAQLTAVQQQGDQQAVDLARFRDTTNIRLLGLERLASRTFVGRLRWLILGR